MPAFKRARFSLSRQCHSLLTSEEQINPTSCHAFYPNYFSICCECFLFHLCINITLIFSLLEIILILTYASLFPGIIDSHLCERLPSKFLLFVVLAKKCMFLTLSLNFCQLKFSSQFSEGTIKNPSLLASLTPEERLEQFQRFKSCTSV